MTTAPSIAVVGAGVVGMSVAVALAERGAHVVVVDRAGLGAGTSAATFAWVNSNRKHPEAYHRLNLAGVAAYHARPDGVGRWFFPSGHVEIASAVAHAAELEDNVARLRSLGYPAEFVTQAQLSAFEPALRLPEPPIAIVRYPQEGYCLPYLLLGDLNNRLRAAGGELHEGCELRSAVATGSGVELTVAGGRILAVDRMVCAVGRWSSELVQRLAAPDGHVTPMPVLGSGGRDLPTLGFLGVTEPVPADVRGVITTSRLNLRPDGGGRLILQALDLDAAADSEKEAATTDGIGRELADRLASLLARPHPVALSRLVVGRRAVPRDGQTIAGWLEPDQRIYGVVTHSGVTLALALGDMVGSEVLGRPAPELKAFRPDRFGAGNADQSVAAPRAPGAQ
jgi:glycine/D-amino acid oxidase-like deaminating enzyme